MPYQRSLCLASVVPTSTLPADSCHCIKLRFDASFVSTVRLLLPASSLGCSLPASSLGSSLIGNATTGHSCSLHYSGSLCRDASLLYQSTHAPDHLLIVLYAVSSCAPHDFSFFRLHYDTRSDRFATLSTSHSLAYCIRTYYIKSTSSSIVLILVPTARSTLCSSAPVIC
jgi:hypothetical protein